MAVLGGDHTGNTVLIYDSSGNHLGDTVITSYSKAEQHIQVRRMPKDLKVNDDCKLLILSTPAPREYLGKLRKTAGLQYIALFQGQEKESRGATRYSVNTPALIDELIVDNKPFPLHTPVKLILLNISTSGVRFRAPYFSLNDGHVFKMHMVISGSAKTLIAQVLNHVDNEPASSDYGCRFVDESKIK
jgi:hypothetical protein